MTVSTQPQLHMPGMCHMCRMLLPSKPVTAYTVCGHHSETMCGWQDYLPLHPPPRQGCRKHISNALHLTAGTSGGGGQRRQLLHCHDVAWVASSSQKACGQGGGGGQDLLPQDLLPQWGAFYSGHLHRQLPARGTRNHTGLVVECSVSSEMDCMLRGPSQSGGKQLGCWDNLTCHHHGITVTAHTACHLLPMPRNKSTAIPPPRQRPSP